MFPLHLSLTSNGRTADTAREKAECLNSVFASKSCVRNPSLSLPTSPSCTQLSLDSVFFSSDKVESLLSNLDSDSATRPDGISPRVLKTCSSALAHPLSHVLKVICHLLGNQQTSLPCIKRCKNRSLQLQTNQPFPNHQQGYGIHHRFRH